MRSQHPPCPRMLTYRPPRIAMALLLAAAVLQLATPAFWPVLPALPTGGLAVGVLITNDVYGLTRNPMYLGIVMMLLGIALATGSLPCYLASLAFFLIIDAVFCPYEERKLEQAFGAAFKRYRGAVRRWL